MWMTQVSKFTLWLCLSTNVNYFQIGRTVSPVMREMLCDIDWDQNSAGTDESHRVVLRSL